MSEPMGGGLENQDKLGHRGGSENPSFGLTSFVKAKLAQINFAHRILTIPSGFALVVILNNVSFCILRVF